LWGFRTPTTVLKLQLPTSIGTRPVAAQLFVHYKGNFHIGNLDILELTGH
jgi:hypothetical protein